MFLEKDSFLKSIITEKGNIRDVISTIEAGGLRIALVVNKDDKLVGTICDGDIRRGLLRGLNLDSSIESIIERNCFKVTSKVTKKELSRIIKENAISQIPIISNNNELIGLEISEDLLPSSSQLLIPNYALD